MWRPRRGGIVPESSFDWYQADEASELLAAARDDRARTILLVALHAGVRMGEQRAARWSDIDFERRIITIRRSAPKWLSIEKSPKSNRQSMRRWSIFTTTATPSWPSGRRGID